VIDADLNRLLGLQASGEQSPLPARGMNASSSPWDGTQARKVLDFGMERVTLIVRLAPSIERCLWNAIDLADTEDDPHGHF
jgi:hypothetical protein